jgi:hypothetical protein
MGVQERREAAQLSKVPWLSWMQQQQQVLVTSGWQLQTGSEQQRRRQGMREERGLAGDGQALVGGGRGCIAGEPKREPKALSSGSMEQWSSGMAVAAAGPGTGVLLLLLVQMAAAVAPSTSSSWGRFSEGWTYLGMIRAQA